MGIEIRLAATIEDLIEIEELIMGSWGRDERQIIPSSFLMAMKHNSAVILIAEHGGKPIGFCFSFLAFREDGGLKHHSHMNACLPAYRDQGLGERLKLAQKEAVLAQGVGWMSWTYDPLETRNGRLNLHKLGARCKTFLPNLYGARDDEFSAGLPTDRFMVEWHLEGDDRRQTIDHADYPQWNAVEWDDAMPKPVGFNIKGERGAVLVPKDFQGMKRADMGLAKSWRFHVGELFMEAFEKGYSCVDMTVSETHCAYILEKS